MTKDEIILAQQARIEQLRETLQHFALIDLGRDSLPSTFGMDVLASRKALSTHDDLSALRAHDEKLLADAIRYRWIKAEHSRIDPLASLCWKKNSDRSSSDWCNVVDIDKSIDEAIEKGGV